LKLEERKNNAAKQAALEAKKREAQDNERLNQLALQFPRSWVAGDFGQGCGAVALPAKAAANIREVIRGAIFLAGCVGHVGHCTV
jgi:hypothetical protein